MAEDSNSSVIHSLPDKTPSNSNKSARSSLHLIWWFLGFILLLYVVLSVIALRQQPQTQQVTFDPQSASVLSSLSPEVSVKKPESQSFQVIDGSEPITAGTEVTTGEGAQAVIFSGDGILTTIKENSRVRLQRNNNADNQTRLELLAGGLWARISSVLTNDESYQVKAGDTITSVRGTEFEINSNEDSVSVSTIRNEVNVKREPLDAATGSPPSQSMLSGQGVSILADQSPESGLSISNLPKEELQDRVRTHGDTLGFIKSSNLTKQVATMDGLPVLAGASNSQSGGPSEVNFGKLEKIGETLYESLFTQSRSERLRFNLLQIQERLHEINSNKNNQGRLSKLLEEFQSEIVKINGIAENADDAKLQQKIVKALRLYTQNVRSIAESASGSTKKLLQQTENITSASYRSAINALASTNPQLGLKEGMRTMNHQLGQAQTAVVNNNDRLIRKSLEEYDRFVQKGEQITQKNDAEKIHRFANQLRKNLSVFETMDGLSNNIPPGINRTINETRNSVITSQTSLLAKLATSTPERAVGTYEKTTNYYIDRISNSNNSREAKDSVDVLRKYSEFGRELASTPQPVSASTSSLQEKMGRVAKEQEGRLNDVISKFDQEITRGLEQTIKNLQRIQQGRSVTTLGSETSSGLPEPDNGRKQDGINQSDNTSQQQGGQDGARLSDDSGQVDRSSEAASEKSQDTNQSYRNPDKNIIPVQELKTSDPFNLFTFDIEANEMPVNIEGVTARFTINDKEGQQLSYEDVVSNAVLLLGEKRFDVDRFNLRTSSGNQKVYDLMFDMGGGVRFNSSKSKTARLVFLFNQLTGNYKQGTEIRASLEAGSIQTSSGIENQTDVPGAWYILNSE